MAQVIGGVLYSPVNANALMRGDLVTIPSGAGSWRIIRTERVTSRDGQPQVRLTYDVPGFGESRGLLGINEPVLRAVGATAGGMP